MDQRKTVDIPRAAWSHVLSENILSRFGVDEHQLIAALRSEDEVMSPSSLRSIKASPLSFLPRVLRASVSQQWKIAKRLIDVDAGGAGRIIYDLTLSGYRLTFAVRSFPSAGTDRMGRLCDGNDFDFFGVLYDGIADAATIDSHFKQMDQGIWSVRFSNDVFGLTLANRSVRLFDYVIGELSDSRQPNSQVLSDGGGYIIRNAGWYGNGRQGSKAWRSIDPSYPLCEPYALDVFSLMLWRQLGFDVADAAARAISKSAVTLAFETSQRLGVGNSSGMDMVAALVRWPEWLGTFNLLREISLAYAITRRDVGRDKANLLADLFNFYAENYRLQPSSTNAGISDSRELAQLLSNMATKAHEFAARGTIDGHVPEWPWRQIAAEARKFGDPEVVEQTNSILLEVEQEFTDWAGSLMKPLMNTSRAINPLMTVGELVRIIHARYDWSLSIDLNADGAREYFWYRSEESGENRRGERQVDFYVERETFVDVVGAVADLLADLKAYSPDLRLGDFLLGRPSHCHTVARVQLAQRMPYTEIRANIIDRQFYPSDAIRFLLSTIGMQYSAPMNTRYVRGVFLQGAPTLRESCDRGFAA